MSNLKSDLLKGLNELKTKSLSQVLACDDDMTPAIKISPYVDKAKLTQKLNQNSFTIMSLNVQSIAAKFDELNILIHELEQQNCRKRGSARRLIFRYFS